MGHHIQKVENHWSILYTCIAYIYKKMLQRHCVYHLRNFFYEILFQIFEQKKSQRVKLETVANNDLLQVLD